jgi:hypothetical protein
MPIPDRLYNLAKGHLDTLLERWEEIDTHAKQQIDSVLMNSSDTNNMSAWDRAMGKINSANAAKELEPASSQIDLNQPTANQNDVEALKAQLIARGEYPDKPQIAMQATPVEQNTVVDAYKILGVPVGTDYLTIKSTYQQLKERAAPERFPENSAERAAAQDIQQRIDKAFMILTNSLSPGSARFDRLEL